MGIKRFSRGKGPSDKCLPKNSVSLLLPNFHPVSSVYKQLVILNTLRHRTLICTARVTPFRDVTLHIVKIMCCSCVFGSVLQPTPMYYFRCPFACVIPLKYYSPLPHKPLLPLVPFLHFLSLKHSPQRLILKRSVPGIHARAKSLSVLYIHVAAGLVSLQT